MGGPDTTCGRCVMNAGVAGVQVSPDGTCSYCREYFRRLPMETLPPESRERALDDLVGQIQEAGRGKAYDALIGLSGGMDSTYSAYIARTKGLRLLGVHVDNGYNTELAEENIHSAAEKLGIEFVIDAPSFEHFRDLQVAFLRASIPNAEIPTDHVLAATLYKIARERDIRYLINGGNYLTEGPWWPQAFGHFNRDVRCVKGIHRQFGTMSLRPVPTIGIPKTLYYRYIRGMRIVRILKYVDYTKKAAGRILEEETGWKPYPGKHNESIYMRFFQCYVLPKKFGVDKRLKHFSDLISAGQITRDEALAELERDPYETEEMLEEDMQYVLTKLELSRDEFEQIMQLPIRSYRDYPTNRRLYNAARFLARHGLRIGE